MDITNYFGEITTDTETADVQPGKYNLIFVGTDDTLLSNEDGWQGMRLKFKIEGTETFVSHLVTIAHKDPKVVGYGRDDLMKLARAAGIKGSLKNTDELKDAVVQCNVILNEKNYPELDSKFGNAWKPAQYEESTGKSPSEGMDEAIANAKKVFGDSVEVEEQTEVKPDDLPF